MGTCGTKKKMTTWDNRAVFYYHGSVKTGTTVHYGSDFKFFIETTADEYKKMIQQFKGKTVNAGTSKSDPPEGSLGKWIKDSISPNALPSYLAPILIKEKYAKKKGKSEITFL